MGQKPSKWVPFEDPLSTLPETAQKILEAASRLLAERGYAAITLENVAAEAGVNKASIRYNFGNKAGLVAAVVDALIHDECLRLAADLRTVSEQDRLHAAMVGIEGMIVGADSFRGFFDILPHAFRDDDLRERMFELYRWWYHQNLDGSAWRPTASTASNTRSSPASPSSSRRSPMASPSRRASTRSTSTCDARWRPSSCCCAIRWVNCCSSPKNPPTEAGRTVTVMGSGGVVLSTWVG